MNRQSSSMHIIFGTLLIILIASYITATTFFSNHIAYAHTFSENENALFLTLVKQIEAQISLAQNNFHANPKLAEQYASNAIDLLNQYDPVVNQTWTSQISERNSRVANELTSALNSLKSSANSANSRNDVKPQIDRINGLLGEAVSSRVPKEALNNSTTHALVLANLANEVYFSYGRALGQSQSSMTNMAGMAMAEKEASPSSMNTNVATVQNNTSTSNTSNMAMNSIDIKNVTEYQTAQALAGIAKDVFSKNLKSASPSTVKVANTNIENNLNQLKAAIDSKAPFMDVMKIVHIQLHPTLITDYHLQLQSTMH
ncbi:MAG TPA: hypothetical protein VJ729_02225 [Nitrososphaeraceae archaeon]|nr:hypothetical protein [Nitrososphaeraceae archaeon]